MKLAWISSLLADEHKSGESWKGIPNYFFERYGGLKTSYYDVIMTHKKFLDQIGLPQFYKLILLYFLELKESFPNQSGQEQIFFSNKDILIHDHSIFYRNWYDRGIYLVHDLLKADGHFFLTQNSSKNMILDPTFSSTFK